jgi:hypothetical protein
MVRGKVVEVDLWGVRHEIWVGESTMASVLVVASQLQVKVEARLEVVVKKLPPMIAMRSPPA